MFSSPKSFLNDFGWRSITYFQQVDFLTVQSMSVYTKNCM